MQWRREGGLGGPRSPNLGRLKSFTKNEELLPLQKYLENIHKAPLLAYVLKSYLLYLIK